MQNFGYWENLEALLHGNNFSFQDVLENWPSYVHQQDIPRFLAHYEIFKRSLEIPGSIVELGIFKGSSFFTWNTLINTFSPFDLSKRVIGFDSFQGLVNFSEEDETQQNKSIMHGQFKTNEIELSLLSELHAMESPYGHRRTEIIKGNIEDTLPDFLNKNPGLKISILHLDLDLYAPTKLALELLYPRVSRGGIICLDEYADHNWPGETLAADEYFQERGISPTFEKYPFSQSPGAFIIKD